MNSENIKLSVIMPGLNEEKNIALAIDNAVAALTDNNINGEVIVINDGSTDSTPSILDAKISQYGNDKIRVIAHDKPRGIGRSFWEGVRKAKGETVVMLPGDNENDPWEIFRYVGLLDHVDMVIPFVFNKNIRSIFRNVLSFIYRFMINATFQVNFNYTNGTILYRRSILLKIPHRSKGFFFQAEILIKMAQRGYLFAEVPYRLGLRPEGISRAVTFPSFLQVVRGYINLVNDIYFNKSIRKKRGAFSEDSQSAKRKNNFKNEKLV